MPPSLEEPANDPPPVLLWLARLAPLFGIVLGPFAISSENHWAWSSVSGAFFGLAISFCVWKDLNVAPVSTAAGVGGAVALLLSLISAAMFIWDASLGTYVVIVILFVGVLWALTRS
jgi:hypothetical protein